MPTRNQNIFNTLPGSPIGLCSAALLYLALTLISANTMPDILLQGDTGICLPSPNQWQLTPTLTLISALSLTALALLLTVALNRRFNIIPGTSLLYAGTLLSALATNPWTTPRPSSALLLLTATLICTYILFSQYTRRHTAQGHCIIFSILSWGSMIQYAFILLMPIFLLGAIFTSTLRTRSLIGIILGIITPYWITLGPGIITPQDINTPTLTNLLNGFTPPHSLFLLMLAQGITALVTLLLTATNALTLTAPSQQQRSYNAFLNLLGIAMVWYMIFDATNLLTYTATLTLCLAIQTGRYAAAPRRAAPLLPLLITIPALLAIYTLIIK